MIFLLVFLVVGFGFLIFHKPKARDGYELVETTTVRVIGDTTEKIVRVME